MSSFFSSLKKEANLIGKEISRGADDVGKAINHTFDEHRSSPILDLFLSGNVVQFISRKSGRTLQIVQAPTGQLVVDGMGPEGPTFYNAHWTVLNEGNNIVRLYNQSNYLAIVNGSTIIVPVANPAMAGVETKLRLGQTGQFVTLESFKGSGHHIGILQDGSLKSALATGKEMDAHFGVRLIHSPYAMAAAPGSTTVVTTTTTYKKK